MGRTVGRLLICLPPALAAGLFILGDRSAGIEPDPQVRVASATADPNPALPGSDILPGDYHESDLSGPKYVGAAGCAAANCHGGDGLNGTLGSEHSVWIQKDPHAGAYAVLLNQQSQDIIKLLKNSPRYGKMLEGRGAHETRLCLDCHSVAPQASQLAEGHKFSLRDGVSCEGCHGPAEKWLDPHKRYDWQFKTDAEKRALGFWNTDNLLTRARICADCHIGSKNREVNHDLMAAGHPRLTFEMSAYFSNLPPHWNPNEDRRRHALNNPRQPAGEVRSAFEAKLWAIGQLAVAENSVELLQERAENPYKVWPEFTEYGCFACHHNLQPSNWRQERGFADRRPGGYPWGTWQFPVLAMVSPDLAAGEPNPFLQDNSLYEQLKTEMSRPIPDRKKVADLAGRMQGELDKIAVHLDQMSFSEPEIVSLLHTVAGPDGGQKLVGQNWDAAAQVYLATVALYQGLADAEGRVRHVSEQDKAVYKRFQEIRANLKFPEEKPDTGKPAIYNSPKSFEETAPDPVKAIKSQLDGINQAVKP